MASYTNNVAKDFDEAEEDALLRSDEDCDVTPPYNEEALLEEEFNQLRETTEDVRNSVDASLQRTDVNENDAVFNEKVAKNYDFDEESEGLQPTASADEDSAEEHDQVMNEYSAILNELKANPYIYDKNIRLCDLAHSTDDLDIIRQAYDHFAKVYPLSPELWLKFISVEKSVSQSLSEVENVVKLFRNALADYFSIDVAIEFASIAPLSADAESIWNEILGTYGLDVMRGRKLFMLYRNYVDSNAALSVEEKLAAYIASFIRELKYPLNGMEESYIEFKVFYEKNRTAFENDFNWGQTIDKLYFKAKEKLLLMLPYERKLEAIDDKCYRERGEVFVSYIGEAFDFLDDANVLQTLCERMVTACCLNDELWERYIDFIVLRDKDGKPAELQNLPVFQQSAVDVNSRALRNCSWSARLYIKRMQLLEQQEKSREEVQEVLESSMSVGFQTPEPAVAIWMEYLTYLRRNTNFSDDNEYDILRKNFNLAWRILGQQWGVLADPNCEMLKFWGRLEYGPLQDPSRGKELWNTVMESSDNGISPSLWTEFAHLEMRYNLDAARKIYLRALRSVAIDSFDDIVSNWNRFERCNGTITTLTVCEVACAEVRAERLSKQHARYESSAKDNDRVKKSQPVAAVNKLGGGKRKPSGTTSEATAEKKVKHGDKLERKSAEQKHRENALEQHERQEIDLNKDHLRIFLSNLDYNLSEDEIRKNLPELKITSVDLIRSVSGKSRGFGYLELESASEVEKALALDRRNLNGRPLYISGVLRDKEQRLKFKYSDDVEPKKLFIKGLPHDTTQAELEKIYSVYGELKDVRPVYHKSGKFKNIAYVEFIDERAASKALMATDQLVLREHTLFVAISAPPPKPTAPATSNASKSLGQHSRRSRVFDQKPRMSLIPNVVRKQLAETITPNGSGNTPKSNEDFRKLLQK